jgi:hypothetical protein
VWPLKAPTDEIPDKGAVTIYGRWIIVFLRGSGLTITPIRMHSASFAAGGSLLIGVNYNRK